jgi:hypothetical protein
MTQISKMNEDQHRNLGREIQLAARGKRTLEEAARAYTSLLFAELKESVLLTRLFATTQNCDLPSARAQFVHALSESAGVSGAVNDGTLVLNLLGTAGEEPDWMEPMKSKGHVGIPLVSSAFVGSIPMMSRLLHQLGAGIDWIDQKDTSMVARALGMMGGVFFVEDAETEVDSQGRKVIAAQDFVKRYGVKSVFGFGGGYAGTQTFLVVINFLRDKIDKQTAERFLSGIDRFKASTIDQVRQKAVFQA